MEPLIVVKYSIEYELLILINNLYLLKRNNTEIQVFNQILLDVFLYKFVLLVGYSG